jgi:putative redox protein
MSETKTTSTQITAHMTWTGGRQFLGQSDSGHAVVMDSTYADHPVSSAATPMEMVLMALCACTGMDVASILEKMRVPLRSLEVSADADRRAEHPRIFTEIRMRYRVTGDVPEDKLERAVKLSEETYCSVGGMLAASTTIRHTWEIVPA